MKYQRMLRAKQITRKYRQIMRSNRRGRTRKEYNQWNGVKFKNERNNSLSKDNFLQ